MESHLVNVRNKLQKRAELQKNSPRPAERGRPSPKTSGAARSYVIIRTSNAVIEDKKQSRKHPLKAKSVRKWESVRAVVARRRQYALLSHGADNTRSASQLRDNKRHNLTCHSPAGITDYNNNTIKTAVAKPPLMDDEAVGCGLSNLSDGTVHVHRHRDFCLNTHERCFDQPTLDQCGNRCWRSNGLTIDFPFQNGPLFFRLRKQFPLSVLD